MKKFMLSAAGIASVAIAGGAIADTTIAFDISGPGGNMVGYNVGASGTAGVVTIDVDFTNAGGWTWAGDLLIAFVDSNGFGVEWGGYDQSFGFDSLGDFSSGWDSSASGSYSASFDLSGAGLADIEQVFVMDGYSSGASTDNWNGSMTIAGVDVPAPGALALLGLAGLAGRRRRR